jgi:hypothetical protein
MYSPLLLVVPRCYSLFLVVVCPADFQWPMTTAKEEDGAGGVTKTTTTNNNGMDFHIFVEDGDGEGILHHERFHLRKKELAAEHVRTFEVRLCDTCWWYSLCTFQYRQQYEKTGSDHFDCCMYTNMSFFIFMCKYKDEYDQD